MTIIEPDELQWPRQITDEILDAVNILFKQHALGDFTKQPILAAAVINSLSSALLTAEVSNELKKISSALEALQALAIDVTSMPEREV